MKPFDNELLALIGKIKHHLEFITQKDNYKSADSRADSMRAMRDAYKKVCTFPVNEITSSVWNKLDYYANQALIN